jgi:hypothetical protein
MNMVTAVRRGFKSVTSFGILAVMLALPAVSRAAIVYTNFDAGLSYNPSFANEVGDDLAIPPDNLAEADTFTPTTTLDLSSIEIPLSCLNTSLCPNNFTVELTTDSSGSPNTVSAPLASFTVTGSTLPIFGVTTHLTLTYSGPTLALNAGTAYWIVVLPDASGTDQIEWNTPVNTNDTSAEEVAFAGGGSSDSWFALGGTPNAYEVDGTVPGTVPEPGTIGMMLGGGLLLGFIRKVRG